VDDCTVCHYGRGGPSEASACGDSANLKMIRDEIEIPGSGVRGWKLGFFTSGSEKTGTVYFDELKVSTVSLD